MLLVGVGAFPPPDGSAPAQGVGDVFAGDGGPGGDDEEILSPVERLNDAVHQYRLEDQTQDGEQAGLHVEDEEGGGGDEHVGEKQRPAHIKAGVLFEDHGDDVGAAGRGVDVKENGRAKGGKDDREEELQHLFIGEGSRHGADPLEELDNAGIEKGTVHSLQTKALVEHGKAQEEKKGIDDTVVGRSGEPGKGPDGQRLQNDRQTRHAAHGEVVGELEEINADGHQYGAQGHEQEFTQQRA